MVAGVCLAMPLSRNLASIHSGLHELRLKDRGGQIRVFYFIKKGDAIYMLHAFKKKTQELPKVEDAQETENFPGCARKEDGRDTESNRPSRIGRGHV